MSSKKEVLSLFHHIHHINNLHEVHHCGGKHKDINQKLNYTIKHCKCGKHQINKETAIGHVTNEYLESIEMKVKFSEKCSFGGWHIESGIKIDK